MESAKTLIALICEDDVLRKRLTRDLTQYDWTNQSDGARALVVDAVDEIPEPTFSHDAPVIVLSATVTFASARAWFRAGASDVLERSTSPEELATAIEAALAHAASTHRAPRALGAELFHLRDVSQAVAEGAELPWIFDRIVQTVSEALGVNLVSLMLLEPDPDKERDVLRIKAARGLEEKVARETKIVAGEAISGKVLASGQPLLVPNVEQAGLGIAENRQRYAGKGLLSVPIKARQKTIGVLNVNNKTNGEGFDQSDLALLLTLCNQAGLAIDNASLFDQLRRHAQELSALNRQLKHISQAKSELIVNLSHELKTPLTAIQGYVDLLKSGLIEEDKVSDILAKVHERSRHLSRLTERLVSFFALDSGLVKFYRQPFKFDVFVWKCTDELRERAKVRQVALDVDAPSLRQAVIADEQHYRELLLALLDNAIKFNRKGGAVRIYGRLPEENPQTHLEVFVEDTGTGIANNLRDIIFDDFRQTDDIMTAKPDGLGLGLAIAKAVTKGHKCDLRLAATGPEGTSFSFTIPLHREVEEIE